MVGWVDHPTNHDRTSSFDSSFGSSGAVPAAAVFEADQGIDGYLPLAPDLGLGPRLGPPPPVRASTLNNPVGQPYAHSMHSGTHDGSMLERSAMPLGTGVRGQGDLGNHHDDGRVSSTARPGSSAADLSLSAFSFSFSYIYGVGYFLFICMKPSKCNFSLRLISLGVSSPYLLIISYAKSE